MPRSPAFLLLLALGCRAGRAARGPAAGQLELHWRDSARAVTLLASAEARWCAQDTLLELLAIHRDTAFGLALLARDSLRADSFPVFQSGVFAPGRPQASAALRTLGVNDLKGYTSTWGVVQLSAVSARRVSGSFDFRAKLSGGTDTLHLTGSFDRVAVLAAGQPCGRSNKPRKP